MLTQAFAEALAEAEKLIAGAPFVASEQDLAEGYEYLAGSIQASLRLAWAYQRDFPYFVQSTGPYTKMGLDNPDTLYFHAYLRDDAEYVVTGRRGSTADLSFQVLKGDYSPVEVPDSLSAFDDRAIEVGAKGYVSKAGDPCDLVEAIRQVGKGETYLPPAIARSIAFAGPTFAQSPLSKLTSREMEILRLLSAGKSLSEIAWLVHSPYKTVANTSSIIRQKLGVRTSAELVRLAIESGVS